MKESIAFTIGNENIQHHRDIGHSNGYVALPEGHPCFGMSYDVIHNKYEISVHGGLTFSDMGGSGPWADYAGMWVVGFDTCHYMDTLEKWPQERVQEEANRLKEQLDKLTSIPEPETIDFDTLIGHPAKLYLCADQSPNTFQLGSVIFEVIEDESDGYRSMMDKVSIKRKDAPTAGNTVLANVLIRKAQETASEYSRTFSGYELIDINTGHTFLKFGTDNSDDYYPCFTYNWNPVTGYINPPGSGSGSGSGSDSEIGSLINQ